MDESALETEFSHNACSGDNRSSIIRGNIKAEWAAKCQNYVGVLIRVF